MIIDSCLLSIGVLPSDQVKLESFDHFIEETILTYCLALNSWLIDDDRVTSLSSVNFRHLDENTALKTLKTVHDVLGERESVKAWLTLSLLKTIKDNQRWHTRVELIDRHEDNFGWIKADLLSTLTNKDP
jgi:hypothetical protein